MYDPARDSWNDKTSEHELEQSSDPSSAPSPVYEKKTLEAEKTRFEEREDGNDNVLKGRESVEGNINVEVKDSFEANSSAPVESKEANGSVKLPQKPVIGRIPKRSRNDSSAIKTTSESNDSKSLDARGSVKVHDNSGTFIPKPASLPDPPRRHKIPSSKLTPQERDARTRQRRERMERFEHDKVNMNEKLKSEEVVRRHYNEKPEQGVQLRKHSPIIKLRSFNNWIKTALIQKVAHRDQVVLDIACGKGGDINKWNRCKIKGYIGVDISDVSIDQAKARYAGLKYKNFWADFCVGDAFDKSMTEIVHPKAFPVDIVSIQFGLHYAFETEARARKLMENVSNSLSIGGKFIGTIPNSDVIIEHIETLAEGEKKWGNSIYQIEFDKDPPREGVFRPPYGHRYTFYLQDAISNVPEYVVPFEAFRALAEEYKLELSYQKPFLQMFDQEIKENPHLLKVCEHMGVYKQDGTYGIEGDEREASGLYLAFIFQKVS